jgi:hypothetical protein
MPDEHALGAASQALGASTQASGASSQGPGAISQAPGASTQASGAALQAPSARTQAPSARTQGPGVRTQALGASAAWHAPGTSSHQAPGAARGMSSYFNVGANASVGRDASVPPYPGLRTSTCGRSDK